MKEAPNVNISDFLNSKRYDNEMLLSRKIRVVVIHNIMFLIIRNNKPTLILSIRK